MLARELNVFGADVSFPLGGLANTELTPPVATSTRFCAMPAAFWSPGDVPEISPFAVNCAIAYPEATVVSSFTTTSPGTGTAPRTLASVTDPGAGGDTVFLATRYSTVPEPGVSYEMSNVPSTALTADPREEGGPPLALAANSVTSNDASGAPPPVTTLPRSERDSADG